MTHITIFSILALWNLILSAKCIRKGYKGLALTTLILMIGCILSAIFL